MRRLDDRRQKPILSRVGTRIEDASRIRPQRLALDCPNTSATPGRQQDVELYYDKWIQLSGTFVGTYRVEGTINGTRWESLGEFSSPEIVEAKPAFRYLRVYCVTHTSGEASALFTGRQTI